MTCIRHSRKRLILGPFSAVANCSTHASINNVMKGKTMSKDILGSLVRVLITVPEDRLGLVQDVALKLSNGDGAQWEEPLKRFLRKESCWSNVKSAEMPAPKPRTDLLKLVSHGFFRMTARPKSLSPNRPSATQNCGKVRWTARSSPNLVAKRKLKPL